ncbi:FliM/FliN family flagellar motor switch protein [Pantoea sp. BAV 3049]|uniref:FliM/FliN family flagellar motor switch protein n=1 Tax=Pantoea sp. BAV 3049 TaxID=2654188 RepID=UPI00131B4C7D|nr:FliM/FliN family flagellar motor switch protein [Pantoea sp. BAV 3049]
MNALNFRLVSQQEAQLRQRIGAGLLYPFTLAGEPGVLRLTLADDCQVAEMSHWRCDAGMLQFSDAQPVLSLMSDCPTFAHAEQAPEQDWYWPWWHQQLSAELLTLFGHLSPEQENVETGEFLLRLNVGWGMQRAQSLLVLSARCLSSLLKKSGWQQDVMPLPESMTLTLPMIIGDLVLSPAELQSLRRGDLLLPPQLYFTPEGRGVVRCGTRLLQGELQMQPGTMAHFYLTEMEKRNVTLTPDEFEHEHQNHPESHWDAEPVTEATDFAPLPLSLSVRCGQLKLTLGELTTLSPGAMVMIENVTPGEAILCHGDYPLAKGELVDVEGKLGLQITHVLPGSKNPLNGGTW